MRKLGDIIVQTEVVRRATTITPTVATAGCGRIKQEPAGIDSAAFIARQLIQAALPSTFMPGPFTAPTAFTRKGHSGASSGSSARPSWVETVNDPKNFKRKAKQADRQPLPPATPPVI
jgi:hypothetical protein